MSWLYRNGRTKGLGQRGVAAVEFALVAAPFFLVLFFVIELALALFHQEALDSALHLAVRQVQTGNAQNVANGSAFIANYLCPAAGRLLDCNSLFVKVEKVTFASGQDFFNATTGSAPQNGRVLDLSSFGSTSFCNASPSEFLLITAVYLSPSVIGALLPNVFSAQYNGGTVHATMSQVATYSEAYTPAAASRTAAAGC
jgi:hypothetical protein